MRTGEQGGETGGVGEKGADIRVTEERQKKKECQELKKNGPETRLKLARGKRKRQQRGAKRFRGKTGNEKWEQYLKVRVWKI